MNWEFQEKNSKIVRVSRKENPANELVIYPSKEKYNLSRKQPFIAYFDRLKQYLRSGEMTFIMSGYSFADQHINDIIFNALRENSLLFCVVFCFSDKQVCEMKEYATTYLNLSVYGPTTGIIRGTEVNWEFQENYTEEDLQTYIRKSEDKIELSLGDFSRLVEFLIVTSGKTIYEEDPNNE